MRYLRFISPHLSRHIHKNPTFLSSLQSAANFTAAAPEQPPPSYPESVSAIASEISGLTLLEVSDLTEVLREKMGIKEMPSMMVMMPGVEVGGGGGVRRSGKGGAAAVEEKIEKTAFDLKLDSFDSAAKIKVIKEVRTFTALGLKEAKDLVEKAPTLLKKGVTKEEAESIMAKMKEIGALVSME